MNRILTLSVALAFAAPAFGQAPPAPPGKAVPFKLLPSRHMLIELTINGKGPYRVIFDTGAPINLVNTRLAKDAGLLKKGQSGFSLFGGGLNTVDIETVKLGEVTIDKLPVVVMDHPTVKTISDAFKDDYGTIDGIVGFPLFARFATTVDYEKKTLTLAPNDYKPGDYLKDLTKALTDASEKQGQPKVIGAAGLWGFAADKASGDDEAGVTVKAVTADGPMEKAGLKAKDRVLTLDGRWTDSLADLYLATSLVKPGRTVEVEVLRDGKKQTLKATPVKGF